MNTAAILLVVLALGQESGAPGGRMVPDVPPFGPPGKEVRETPLGPRQQIELPPLQWREVIVVISASIVVGFFVLFAFRIVRTVLGRDRRMVPADERDVTDASFDNR